MRLNVGRPLPSPQKRGRSSQPRVVKEPSRFSGAKRMQPTECIGRIEHKVAGPTQQLPQGANRPCKAKGGESSHLGRNRWCVHWPSAWHIEPATVGCPTEWVRSNADGPGRTCGGKSRAPRV